MRAARPCAVAGGAATAAGSMKHHIITKLNMPTYETHWQPQQSLSEQHQGKIKYVWDLAEKQTSCRFVYDWSFSGVHKNQIVATNTSFNLQQKMAQKLLLGLQPSQAAQHCHSHTHTSWTCFFSSTELKWSCKKGCMCFSFYFIVPLPLIGQTQNLVQKRKDRTIPKGRGFDSCRPAGTNATPSIFSQFSQW